MSFRNIKSGLVTQNTTSGVVLTLARSDIFFFIRYISYESELYNNPSTLTSKPNVIFYTENSVNKVILDYSFASDTDKIYLKSLFTGLNQISGITLSSGSYLEEAKALEADLSSSLTFSEFKNNYVFATVNSTTNKSASADIYYDKYFIDTPQIISGSTLGQNPSTKRYGLVTPRVGGKSFTNLGFIVGDYIEVVNPNSQNNSIRFEIANILSLNNEEIIELKKEVISENLTGSPSIVNLYVRSDNIPTNLIINTTDTVVDTCLVMNKSLGNNTKYQCDLRGGVLITNLINNSLIKNQLRNSTL